MCIAVYTKDTFFFFLNQKSLIWITFINLYFLQNLKINLTIKLQVLECFISFSLFLYIVQNYLLDIITRLMKIETFKKQAAILGDSEKLKIICFFKKVISYFM